MLVKIVKDDEHEGKYLVEVEKDGQDYQISHVVRLIVDGERGT